jgi:aquaporin Z
MRAQIGYDTARASPQRPHGSGRRIACHRTAPEATWLTCGIGGPHEGVCLALHRPGRVHDEHVLGSPQPRRLLSGDKIGFAGVSFAFGLSLLAMVYAIGPISGCHINPAVTLGVLLSKKMNPRYAPGYLVAQVIGAILAAGILLLIAKGGPAPYDPAVAGFAANGYGEHSPGRYNLTAAFLVEVVLTAVLVLTVLGATAVEAPVGFAGIPIGLVLVLIHLVGIPVTNTSVNPARSIGPAVFVGGWALSQLWLFVVAPLIGAVLAVVVYRGITLPTPELPTRLAEQALPSEQVERQPLTTREAEQALPREQRERRP